MKNENPPPTNLNLIYPSDIAEIKSLLHEIREQRANVLQDYITKADFLQRFDIKPGMLYKLINDSKLKVYRINRKIYFKQSEIDEALNRGLLK